jgi:hypothetical protein
MQHKNKTFWMSITVCMVIGIFFTGCGNSVVAYEDPITITLTGLEGQTTEPLAFIGVFDNEKKIMAGDALAGGFAAIQNGSAAVELWYVEDQSPLIDTGDYYIALMFGKSQSNPTDSYFFIENKQDVKHAF